MLLCLQLFGSSMAIVTVSLLLAYGYPPFSKWNLRTRFWTERYDLVGFAEEEWEREEKEVKGVGLMLEFSLPLMVWFSLLFLCGLVYQQEADDLASGLLAHWATYLIAFVVFVGVAYYSFVGSRREHEELLGSQEGEAFSGLLEDVQQRLRRLRSQLVQEGELDREVGRLSRPYYAYVFYSWNTFTLLLLYVWIVASGLWQDLGDVFRAYQHLDPPDFGNGPRVITERLLQEGEAFYLELGTLLGSFTQLAIGIAGILGTTMLVMFWFLGTRYQTIYTQEAVKIGRNVARAVVVVLPFLIFLCYVGFEVASSKIISSFDMIAGQLRSGSGTAGELMHFNNLRDRISGAATFESFWSQLASSYGGLLVLAGIILSFWQRRTRSWSFLHQLFPKNLDLKGSRFVRALRSVPLPTDRAEGEGEMNAA